ncbi:OmpA family protein [Candidatus Sumerlaeota bacterium]|nr:OmpA family protein [Candidatus Sumerlaeota bacterium]
MKRLLLTVVVVAVMFLAGCTTVQKGAAAGGAVGGVAGGVWGHNYGLLSAAEGALVGTAAGGLVGALAGDQFEEHKEKELEAEVETLKKQIFELEKELRKAKRDKGAPAVTSTSESDLAYLQKKLEEKEQELERLHGLKQQQERDLDQLKKELDSMEVQLAQTPKGLTLTMVESLLFKPGMAEISDKGKALLNNVSQLLKERFPDRELIIEGHTDNQPIKVSGWKSNWELASARALEVLHYMVRNQNFDSRKLSATSYGEFHPVAPNGTEAGRAQNRRAVIVVSPAIDVVHKSLQ